jgi:hypothetical protein
LTSRYRESLSFALPGHFVRTVQLLGWSGLVDGKLLAAAAGAFGVLITGDRNKLESSLPLVGRLLSTLAALQEPRNIELEAEE